MPIIPFDHPTYEVPIMEDPSPRSMITVDANEAVAAVAYRCSEVIAIYPITPSSPMAEQADEWSVKGKKNLWGTFPLVVEMQSEAGAAGGRSRRPAGRFPVHHLYRLPGSVADDPQHVQNRRRAAALRSCMLPPGPSPPRLCPSSAIIPMSWPAGRPALPCSLATRSRRPRIWPRSPTAPRCGRGCRFSTFSTASAPRTRSTRSRN